MKFRDLGLMNMSACWECGQHDSTKGQGREVLFPTFLPFLITLPYFPLHVSIYFCPPNKI